MDLDKFRKILNILFLVGAAASVIIYFAVDDFKLFIIVCMSAIFLKIIEFIIRFH
ncbi:MAG: hypothetical protein PHQ88_06965 [Bacteroides sp.]|nr:hypothetical protein [Bacteroides sp.]MDD2645704.1 hypothetical protein [Bacteroides sp.]MDD4720580.1 hypothetical protein [Bacteroides sp.]NLI64543.1 hypothetical protein [Bacteroidales bacterium]